MFTFGRAVDRNAEPDPVEMSGTKSSSSRKSKELSSDEKDTVRFLDADAQGTDSMIPSTSQDRNLTTKTTVGKTLTTDPDGDGKKQLKSPKWSKKVEVVLEQSDASIPKLCLAHLCTYFQRLHMLNVSDMVLMKWEENELVKGEDSQSCTCYPVLSSPIGPRAVQVICWRRTLLEVSCVCYFCNVCFAVLQLCRTAYGDYKEFGDGKVFGMDLGDYVDYFSGYVVAEYFLQGAILGAHSLGFLFCCIGYQRWRIWSESLKKTGFAYGLGYVSPFVLLMVIPFHLGIDIKGIRTQFCKDIIDGANTSFVNMSSSWPPSKLLKTLTDSKLPGTSQFASLTETDTFGLRHYFSSFNIALPSTDEFCSFDADTWEPYVTNLITDAGRLAYDNGTCPFVQDAVSSMRAQIYTGASNVSTDVNESIATCQQAPCEVCGSDSCLTLLPTLQVAIASAYSYALALNSTGELPTSTSIPPEVALATWGLDMYSAASVCHSCMYGQTPTCAALCLPLWASGQAVYNSSSISVEEVKRLSSAYTQAKQLEEWSLSEAQTSLSSLCIHPSQLVGIEVLVAMFTSTRAFQTILGLKLALRALGALLPITFAMMLGAFKGACIAKTVMPYSRVPGVILIAAVIFSLPHLTTLVIVIKCIFGDFLMLLALTCFLAANLVYLPAGAALSSLGLGMFVSNGILEPDGFDGAYKTMRKRQRCALIFNLLFVMFLLIWFGWSAPLEDLIELGLLSVDFEDVREYIGSTSFWTTLCTTGIDLVTKMYGLTKISQVFFFDMSLYAILLVDETDNSVRDFLFRQDHGVKEAELLKEFHAGLIPDSATVLLKDTE